MDRKPRLVISSCLIGENVRYDGKIIENKFADKLKKFVDIIPICPEVSIGLPVPREKIVLVRKNNSYKVYQPSTGIDFTPKLINFSENFLESLNDIDGFLLKSKSPSCGVSGTKCYKNEKGKGFIGRRRGIFAIKVKEKFKNYPVEDELRIQNFFNRYDFLTKVYLIYYFKILDRKDFIDRFEKILTVYNTYKTKAFIKNPSLNSLLDIFSVKLTENRLKRKLSLKKVDLKYLQKNNFIIFPKELLE